MPDTEFLFYSPIDMNAFMDFFVNGIKDETGKPKRDENDREITGVIAWLHGREIRDAHFFSSAPADPVQGFMAVVQPTDEEDVPWMERIPGFKHMVRDDGKIGDAPSLGVALKGDPLAVVQPRPDLDQVFVDEMNKIAEIDFEKVSFTKEAFLRALQGKKGTNLPELLKEANSKLSLNVLESRAEFQANRD